MISAHEYTLSVAGQRLPILEGSVSLDEGWAPYAQARILLAMPDASALAALDPRYGGRARLTLTARYGSPTPLSRVTETFAGQPLSAITAAWGGLPLRSITASLSQPYNPGGHRDSSVRRLDLSVTDRRIDRRAGTVEVLLASDECLAQDHRALTPMLPPSTSVRTCVGLALAAVGASLEPGIAGGTVSADAVYWAVGETVWDYAHSLVQAVGLRLWCDEARRWHLTEPLDPANSPDVYIVRPDAGHELDEELSREAWASGVIVTYTWDRDGDRQTAHDIAGGGSRIQVVEVQRPYPGPGAAAAILDRVRARGSLVTARQIGTYEVTPGWVMQSLATDTAHLAGIVSSVTWDLTSDQVAVASRDLTDTPARAWIMQPAGYRWTDVPPGTTWDTYTTPTGG